MIMDKKGIEGLPLKLLVTSIVMAIVIPIGWGAFSYYDLQTLTTKVETSMAGLVDLIETLSRNQGNRRSYVLDLEDGSISDVDYARLGGPIGSGWDQLINYSIEGKLTRIALEGYRVSTIDNSTLKLSSGKITLGLESKLAWDGSIYVEVNVEDS